MILQSIILSGWRCFLEEVSLGPFSDRLNVICGPNGIGKSTLFEALRRALMDSHAVSGQDVSAIRPWGRSLSPRVTVAFAHGGEQYRMTKQFLDGGFARLERQENGAFRPLAEGRQADEQARQLLSGNPPGRGLSQTRNWGLAQVLWAPQGELKLMDLSGDLVSDIRAVLGTQVSDKRSSPIEQTLADRYQRYYTRQGKIKSGKAAPPIVHLNEALEKANQHRGQALEMLQRCEAVSRRVEELGARHQQLSLEADELAKSVQTHRARADQCRSLRIDFKNRKSELEKTEAQHRQLQQHLDLIRSTAKEFEEKKIERDQLATEAPLKGQEVANRETEAVEAKKLLDTTRKGDDLVAQAETDAETAYQYVDVTQRRRELGQRIANIEAAEKILNERRNLRANLVAPDRKTLKAVRNAIQTRDEAQLRMDSAMISLEILPETDGLLDVLSGENLGRLSLSAGKTALVKGSPEIVAELKGVARLRASGPAGDIQIHRQTVRDSQKEISERTRPFDTSDIGHLEELTETAENLDRQVGEARKALEALLGDETLDGLKKERVHLDALLEGIERQHPGWKESVPDSEALKRTAADMKREHAQKVSDAETAWEKAHSALSSARQQEQILLGRLEDARKTVRKLETRRSELTRDGKSIKQREAELNRVLLDWDAGRAALKDLADKLERFDDDPETVLAKLEKSLAAVEASVQSTRDEQRTAMGTLETLAAQGPYSILVRAEEEVARLEAEIRREALRMDAVKLLYDTVHRCRTEAVASVAKPVEEAAARLLHRIAGRRIGQIEIGENFGPSAVRPERSDSPVDLLNLSGGEQEQLYLATRLALAEVVARDERQMVVLDDVLTATDTGRLARVMTILEEAAGHLQILVLTCHPERYRALAEAQFFDLESLLNPSQTAGAD